MATKPRMRSASGFYHVFHRGVSLFDIFEDDIDREFYLDRLVRYASEIGVEIHAWCLMSNHTHLLLRADRERLSELMRKLGSVYARFFNKRHGRSGPLFEGRFGSVCVETDAQFVSVVRYIHRNPIHHEEHDLLGGYRWSSYSEYVFCSPQICEIDFALDLFGGVAQLVRFHEEERDRERHLDIGTAGPMRDDEARVRANQALVDAGFEVCVTKIGTLSRKMRDRALACVKLAIGCSLRQLQRLTAVAYSVIRNAVSFALGDMFGERHEEPFDSMFTELTGSLAQSPFESRPISPLPKLDARQFESNQMKRQAANGNGRGDKWVKAAAGYAPDNRASTFRLRQSHVAE